MASKKINISSLGAKISEGNTTTEGWLERENILWRLKQYDRSVEAFDRAIELNPEFVHLAYYGKGVALNLSH
ncbi:tetratricopeptide repeat protein [Waterburya agarophytonicola K14]|uniref:Tetratricopeptide repeat protein n=1 Tax=Waterburya agarophytonicola KI4 TaxID=2874699 RepID=A0A964BTD4_9CYAN|nr:tetratricopeptide repeat protein [Waterburya agarophytonicola KI4]